MHQGSGRGLDFSPRAMGSVGGLEAAAGRKGRGLQSRDQEVRRPLQVRR